MAHDPAPTEPARIEALIHVIRGQRVMLDSDLARIYKVNTSQLNQQLKRNQRRFPTDFAFRLTRKEFTSLISQIVISKKGRGGRRQSPWVFTEHGAIMLASVLNSPTAIKASVFVVRAFVRMREALGLNKELAAKLSELERRVIGHDAAIQTLFDAIRELIDPGPAEKAPREIGFHVKDEQNLEPTNETSANSRF